MTEARPGASSKFGRVVALPHYTVEIIHHGGAQECHRGLEELERGQGLGRRKWEERFAGS
jgi:hypothetical protein